MNKKHYLKTWPAYFEAVADGRKTFEIRKDDRGFNPNDILILREWIPGDDRYTGRALAVRVTYITDFGQDEGTVVMAIVKCAPPVVRRGDILRFRKHLNKQNAAHGGHRHRQGRFHQRVRAYGDYLYAQDREKFMVDFIDWLAEEQNTVALPPQVGK